MQATGGGVLQFSGNGGGAFNNAGGIIRAMDGSEVQLHTNASISGGTLSAAGSGVIRALGGYNVVLSNVTLEGSVIVDNNTNFGVLGSITNSGNILVNSTNNATNIDLQGLVSLVGGGTISLSGADARVGGGGFLINRDNIIQGAGSIGMNAAGLTNAAAGVIVANTAGGTMFLDPNPFLGMVNDGTLRAAAGGTLQLWGNGGGQFTVGDAGSVEALDGGTVTNGAGAVLTNNSGGTLRGGNWRAISTGNAATLNLPGGNITRNEAAVTLSGAEAQFAQLAALQDNAGSLDVSGGKLFSTQGSLTNSGQLTAGQGGTVAVAGAFSQTAAGTLNIGINGRPAAAGANGLLQAGAPSILAGVLRVIFNPAGIFVPVPGDVWDLILAPAISGIFAAVQIQAESLPANSELLVDQQADRVSLRLAAVAPLTGGDTYAKWLARQEFAKAEDSAAEADPDGDSLVNLMEYALGRDPLAARTPLTGLPDF